MYMHPSTITPLFYSSCSLFTCLFCIRVLCLFVVFFTFIQPLSLDSFFLIPLSAYLKKKIKRRRAEESNPSRQKVKKNKGRIFVHVVKS